MVVYFKFTIKKRKNKLEVKAENYIGENPKKRKKKCWKSGKYVGGLVGKKQKNLPQKKVVG